MKIFQPIISGSFTTSGSIFLKGLTSAAQSNVITIDTTTGQLYTTASSALGGGGGGTGNGFPFTGNAQITGSLLVTDTVQIGTTGTDSLQQISLVANSSAAAENLYNKATGSYTSAFVKYTISKGTNARAGEFVTVWNGTTATYYDNSTTDIGNTADVVITSAIVSSQIKIDATCATSGWKIKALATFL